MNKISIIRKTSIVKTILFNLHYFGWRGIKPKVLISRDVKLKKIGGNVCVSNPTLGGIKLGYGHVGIIDEKNEKTVWENGGTVLFHGRAWLDVGTRIVCGENAVLEIGENCHVMGRSSFICMKKITIGKECLISWDSLFMDSDFHKVLNTADVQINSDREICIGDHVWIGCRCLILKGAYIPKESVIVGGSTISKKLSRENTVYVNDIEKKNMIKWKA